jgi:hypothetical protein
VLRSEHTAQEFVKIDEWTRPAGISRNGNIGPKTDWARSPATYRGTNKKIARHRAGLSGWGRPSVLPLVIASAICVQSRRHPGVSSRTPRTLSAALGDDFRDVRGVGFGPLVLRTIGHDFRRAGNALSRRTRCSRRSCQSTEAAMRTRPVQKAGTPRPEKLERAEPDLIANPDRVQAHFVMAEATGRRAPRVASI